MKRRKAVIGISIAGAGLITASAGYNWFNLSKKPDLPFVLQQKALIAALAETIIPSNETPGAKETAVVDFIIKMIQKCSSVKTQNNFIDGLKDLQRYCQSKFGKSYQQCLKSDQISILSHFEKKGISFNGVLGKVQYRILGKSFFSILKDLTVEGYCTSELGATRALSYLYVPGSFNGCIDMKPGQKAWATN